MKNVSYRLYMSNLKNFRQDILNRWLSARKCSSARMAIIIETLLTMKCNLSQETHEFD